MIRLFQIFGALFFAAWVVSAQDDPAPMIGRYLVSTLVTFPLAALYLFVILPRVDGAGMLILTLAPALVSRGRHSWLKKKNSLLLPPGLPTGPPSV